MEKNCEYCKELFKAAHYNTRYCSKGHYKECEACGKDYLVKNLSRPGKACSRSCSSKLSHTEEARNNRKNKSFDRRGVEFPLQSIEVKKKIKDNPNYQNSLYGSSGFKENMLAKYGVENFSQLMPAPLALPALMMNTLKTPVTEPPFRTINYSPSG